MTPVQVVNDAVVIVNEVVDGLTLHCSLHMDVNYSEHGKEMELRRKQTLDLTICLVHFNANELAYQILFVTKEMDLTYFRGR